ncbi:antA/AntB antirepressor family protein [Pontibacterium sp.]|uniref:antA/AntB antirepressor family protein n=1 Tax=Pontibacterium sp. TaxID=2036026 RepID=UPI0035642E64
MNSIAVNQENKSLITIYSRIFSGKPAEAVNARELHRFLEVGRDFSNWVKARISKYGFVEKQDYILIRQNGRTNGKGGDRRSIEYFVTVGVAKELAMVENNEKGRQARLYFIECERRLIEKLQQETKQSTIPSSQGVLGGRFVVEIHNGQFGPMIPVDSDSVVIPFSKIADLIRERVFVEPEELVMIGQACMDRLSKKALARRN